MNHNIRKVLDAIAILSDVQGCELECSSLSHKLQAMYSQGKEGLEGVAFIDACSDDELVAALVERDPRTKFVPFICPFTFNYVRKHRPGIIERADAIRLGR
jgi:hypothetical protein